MRVTHYRGNGYINGYIPAESFIEQIVFRSGSQILASSDNMGYAHEVIVYNIGEIIGGQVVAFQKDHIIERAVFNRYVTVNLIVKRCGAASGRLHSYDVRFAAVGALL